MLDQITPLVLTYNEAPNIGRTLEKLSWAKEVVVVDSFSTDETLEIIRKFPQVRLVQRKFDNHTAQWNFGLAQVRTDWVLSLDADYVLSEELIHEIRVLKPPSTSDLRPPASDLRPRTSALPPPSSTGEVANSLSTLNAAPTGYSARFRYCIQGR